MAFAIMRTKKLKSGGAIAASAQHTFRERDTPNADPDVDNVVLKGPGSTDALNRAIQARTPERYRKDAVRVIEVMISASPEAFERHGGKLGDTGDGYFHDSMRWLEDTYGEDNVVGAVVHLDERTPHLVAYVVPNKDGKLNAKHWLGGRQKMTAQQDSFAAVGKRFGLERGLERSRAKHASIQQFYAAIDGAPDRVPDPPKRPAKPVAPKPPKGLLLMRAKALLGAKPPELTEYENRLARHGQAMREHEKLMRQFVKDRAEHERALMADYAAAKAHGKLHQLIKSSYGHAVDALRNMRAEANARAAAADEKSAKVDAWCARINNTHNMQAVELTRVTRERDQFRERLERIETAIEKQREAERARQRQQQGPTLSM